MVFCCCRLVTNLCLTLCDPMDCSLLGSSVRGLPRQEYWGRLPFLSPGNLPDPRTEPTLHALAGRFFTAEPPRDTSMVLFYSVQSCPTLCDPMDCSMPGLPVHHQHPELLKHMSFKSVMPTNHLILCCSLLLLPSIFPSIRDFSDESVLLQEPKETKIQGLEWEHW